MRGPLEPIISGTCRAGRGSRTASSTEWKDPWSVTRSPASSPRTIANASSKRLTRRANGGAGALARVPAGAGAGRGAPAAALVDGGRHLGEHARWTEAGAGDERAELDA